MLISKEQFIKTINFMKQSKEQDRQIQKVLSPLIDGGIFQLNPGYEDTVIHLLELLTHDDEEWISYFIYELDFGKDYKEGTIYQKNEKTGEKVNIKLSTVEDLYNYLEANFILE